MTMTPDRIFVEHIPRYVETDSCIIPYDSWEDLEKKIRRIRTGKHPFGCGRVCDGSVTLLEIYKTDKVWWWVLGTAYGIPGDPPWPYWKDVVRELGGRI